ncbi:putative exported protein [Pectobacterium atrosepticum SCRI1043]|uniref:Exported protein n=1 Tax=Pectobacterium atrosepticum (strain SCRI 1043 / ATCC BAA-672) TaxID=218491 RepID=Q6D4X3_PECAS|nr:SgcJ/EcaC family oxidoreductase [Pectobacterium atrosepticum]MCL6315738.1 SgcJ/EcaC family oxidoreductase [Pectobacterium atrosepticum]MCL6320026.1 SgcJ/EcaC family oxidoreductase [Pectobacterium atrosepticum]PWD67473.1 SgcJ/EcaC family oxidoreductase [Pectobacterium atrosepticum]CAG75170.1 putative exported protein [Pectobacterium atrosepticum SCRI1043]
MLKKTVLTLAMLGALASTSVQAAQHMDCVQTSQKEIASLFDRWNASLQTGDAKKVAKNYAPDAVLLPTLSNKPRTTDAERIDYFEHFLAKKPVGKIDTSTIRIGCNKAVDTGTYTFTFGDGSVAKARYTYTYAWNGKQWLITTHHSSANPSS